MDNKEILKNAPEGATHVDSFEDDGACRYLTISFSQTRSVNNLKMLHAESDTRSLADIKRIVELESKCERQARCNKELDKTNNELEKERDALEETRKNLIWFTREEIKGLDPEQTGFIDLRVMKLEQMKHAVYILYCAGKCDADSWDFVQESLRSKSDG